MSLRLASTLSEDNVKEGTDAYFECEIRAKPKHFKLEWRFNVSNAQKMSMAGRTEGAIIQILQEREGGFKDSWRDVFLSLSLFPPSTPPLGGTQILVEEELLVLVVERGDPPSSSSAANAKVLAKTNTCPPPPPQVRATRRATWAHLQKQEREREARIQTGPDAARTCVCNFEVECFTYLTLSLQGQELREDKRGGVLFQSQTLVLQGLSRNATGTYYCVATNSEGAAFSNPLKLDVKCKEV